VNRSLEVGGDGGKPPKWGPGPSLSAGPDLALRVLKRQPQNIIIGVKTSS